MKLVATERRYNTFTMIAWALTALYYYGGIDWPDPDDITAPNPIGLYVITLVMATLPYIGLRIWMGRSQSSPLLRKTVFYGLLLSPVLLFPLFRALMTPTYGWDYMLVPCGQLMLQGVLIAGFRRLRQWTAKYQHSQDVEHNT